MNTTLQSLQNSKNALMISRNFISIDKQLFIRQQLLESFKKSTFNLHLPDGVFFPFPYSSVHKNIPEAEKSYFKFSADFNSRHKNIIDIIINSLKKVLNEEIFPFSNKSGMDLAMLNTRILFAQKNGIDIHCENAFIHQLEEGFSKWLMSKVDLKNAFSFFLVLQKPEIGGDLVVFNKTWDEISFPLDSTTYEERHDINGSIFKNRGVDNISYNIISLEEGDAIVFKAAQTWHAIDKIEGTKDRITIGCFIAKGYDGRYYYWA